MVENRGPQLRAVVATFVSLAFVATSLRCYVRLFMVKSFGWDDTVMVLATLTHIMFATCSIGGTRWGTGRHYWDLTEEGFYKAMRYWWLCYVAYCLTMILAKISIGIFLLRLTVNKIHNWIIYTVMGLSIITGLVFLFVTIFQCSPISYFWNRNQPGSCINVEIIIALTYLYSAINAICDFTFGLLPFFLIWNLNMDRRTKVALIPILSMACVASSAVIVRMGYVKDFKTNDFLYKTVDIAIWSDIEQSLAITAGSLATLRPIFKIVSSHLGLTSGSRNPKSPMPTPGRPSYSNHLDRSAGNPRSSRARRGPFSFGTTLSATQHERNELDEEFRLNNIKPMKLQENYYGDEEQAREQGKGNGKGEGSYWVREKEKDADGESQEELNRRQWQAEEDGGSERMYLPGRFLK